MSLLPCLNFVTRIIVNETRSTNGLIHLLLISVAFENWVRVPYGRLSSVKIEFVWSSMAQNPVKNERMDLNDDDKTSLMIDGSEVSCVLLKHGPTGAMDVEFRGNQEIYGAFADQCSGNLDVNPRKVACWADSSLTPVESFGPGSPRVLVRSLAFVFFAYWNFDQFFWTV